MLYLAQDLSAENQRFDVLIELFRELFGCFTFANDFQSTNGDALHDFFFFNQPRKGDLQPTQLFAVDVVLHDMAAYCVDLLTPQRRVQKPRNELWFYFCGGEAKADEIGREDKIATASENSAGANQVTTAACADNEDIAVSQK